VPRFFQYIWYDPLFCVWYVIFCMHILAVKSNMKKEEQIVLPEKKQTWDECLHLQLVCANSHTSHSQSVDEANKIYIFFYDVVQLELKYVIMNVLAHSL
jgi:hypothetical protein